MNLTRILSDSQDQASIPQHQKTRNTQYKSRFQRKAKKLIDLARNGKHLNRTQRRIVRHYTDQQRRQLALSSLKTEGRAA